MNQNPQDTPSKCPQCHGTGFYEVYVTATGDPKGRFETYACNHTPTFVNVGTGTVRPPKEYTDLFSPEDWAKIKANLPTPDTKDKVEKPDRCKWCVADGRRDCPHNVSVVNSTEVAGADSLEDVLEDYRCGAMATSDAMAKILALISTEATKSYKQGYLDSMDKKQPRYLLGFDPLNLPVEDSQQ